MPFTPAHAVVALPFVRTPLVPAAIAIGAMTPDIPLFFRTWPPYDLTHSWLGVVTIDLVLAFALLLVWRLVLRPAVIPLTPRWFALRWPREWLDGPGERVVEPLGRAACVRGPARRRGGAARGIHAARRGDARGLGCVHPHRPLGHPPHPVPRPSAPARSSTPTSRTGSARSSGSASSRSGASDGCAARMPLPLALATPTWARAAGVARAAGLAARRIRRGDRSSDEPSSARSVLSRSGTTGAAIFLDSAGDLGLVVARNEARHARDAR